MTGLPSPVPATNKTSTSTETHVVKDFLGFLDQQFFLLDIKILFGWEIKCGNIFHVGVTDILSSSLFFEGKFLLGMKLCKHFT